MTSVETYPSNSQAAAAVGGDGVFLGGGTLIMRALNYGEQGFARIVRSNDAALRQISMTGDRISIGAGVTMSQVASSSDLTFLAPVARSVGGPAIRNMATVGGNLFAEHPYGDFAVALLALNGSIKSENGSDQDLEAFLASRASYQGLVTEVSVARPSTQDFFWKKVSRVKPKGISVMSLAAWLPQSGGRVSGARIAFGAMGATPLRAKSAEAALEGKSLDSSSVTAACAALGNDLQPPDDAIASSWYRREVAPVHLRRLLLREGEAQ